MSKNNNRDLGEHRAIPRRDFLQGALVASATALAGPLLKAYAAEGDEVLYSEHGFLMYPISTLKVGAVPVKAKAKARGRK